jgi:hypothetical protein
MKNIKKFLKVRYLFLALVLWYVMRGALNYSGFCWEQKRWLSDEELKIVAIERFINPDDPELYLKENPDCCYINEAPKFDWADWQKRNPNIEMVIGYSNYDNFLNKVTGHFFTNVVVVHKENIVQYNSKNCGNIYNKMRTF